MEISLSPPWMEPKPCAICRDIFIPSDPRQELCPQHHRALIFSTIEVMRDPPDTAGAEHD